MADERQDSGLLVEAPAGEPHVRGIGWKLVQRWIDREPQAAPFAFVDVHLRPRVVVERAAHVNEADGKLTVSFFSTIEFT